MTQIYTNTTSEITFKQIISVVLMENLFQFLLRRLQIRKPILAL